MKTKRKICNSMIWVLIASAMAFPMATTGFAGSDDTIVVGLQAEAVTFDPTQISDLNTARVVRWKSRRSFMCRLWSPPRA